MSPWPTTSHPGPTSDEQPAGGYLPYSSDDAKHVELPEVGQVVHRAYFDHYTGPGGQDATQTGIVIAVDADTGLVTVAPLPEPFVAPADELT